MNSTSFHWDAADYAANSSAQYQWGCELIARLALRDSENVLDLGCGDGKLTALMAQQAHTVTGIDASPQMVALAQRRWGGMRNMAFACVDAQQLTFDGVFDAVISNSVLHWVPNHPAVLAGLRRALKPGGRVLLQMPASGNCAQFIEAVDRVRAMPRWRPFFRAFRFPWRFSTECDYTRWLDESGLATQNIITVHKDMCHDSPMSLAGWMRSTWLPYLQCVPSLNRVAFVESVVDDYLCAVPTDAQGRTHVEMVRLEVAAERA
ncbi:MAG: methyltransferase domain-containing protein [Gammaproteobacteria bacterium]|nr:methyltransferase domain-containing protein [Gammaproteobacteria bacterium]